VFCFVFVFLQLSELTPNIVEAVAEELVEDDGEGREGHVHLGMKPNLRRHETADLLALELEVVEPGLIALVHLETPTTIFDT